MGSGEMLALLLALSGFSLAVYVTAEPLVGRDVAETGPVQFALRQRLRPQVHLQQHYLGYSLGRHLEFTEGDTLSATCSVNSSRNHPATLAWLIDEAPVSCCMRPVQLHSDGSDAVTVTQQLRHVLRWRDHGAMLRCVARYSGAAAAAADLQLVGVAQTQLQVAFAPQPMKVTAMERLGFKAGQPGVVSLEVRANPPPTFLWRVPGLENLMGAEGDRQYSVEQPRQIGDGSTCWEARLRIKSVSPADFHKNFQLEASNDLGYHIYNISISSTSAKSLKLGIASIAVSIVVLCITFVVMIVAIIGLYKHSKEEQKLMDTFL